MRWICPQAWIGRPSQKAPGVGGLQKSNPLPRGVDQPLFMKEGERASEGVQRVRENRQSLRGVERRMKGGKTG